MESFDLTIVFIMFENLHALSFNILHEICLTLDCGFTTLNASSIVENGVLIALLFN